MRTTTCPECDGEGIYRTGATKDPATGTWEAVEHPCVWCDGTGTARDDSTDDEMKGAA